MRLGRIVYVQFDIRGPSDSVNTSFTLPYQAQVETTQPIRANDNSSALTTPGLAVISAGSATCNLYSDCSGAAWTASNNKLVRGEFWYYTDESAAPPS